MHSLEEYNQDASWIDELSSSDMTGELYRQALDAALHSHAVTKYVLRSDIEDFEMHPAISEFHKNSGRKILSGNGDGYMVWSLPGRDKKQPEKQHCGVFLSSSLGDSCYTACSQDSSHYIKMKSWHCWSMKCPNCMNDTCLRTGARIEKKLVSYIDLRRRKGLPIPQMKHWVLSPPQNWAIAVVQSVKRFNSLIRASTDMLQEFGMSGGLIVFHPWRLGPINEESYRAGDTGPENQYWRCGPHFHILGYGFIDGEALRASHPGWVLAQVHAGEEIRSVRQTIAYLLTHAGIGMSEETFPRSSASDALFESFMSSFSPDTLNGRSIDEMEYTGGGRYEHETSSGRVSWTWYGDHVEDFDFEDFAFSAYVHTYRTVRFFGDLHSSRMGVVGTYTDREPRICPVCGNPMCVYHGLSGGEPVKYMREIKVFADRKDIEFVRSLYEEKKPALSAEGLNFLDYSLMLPQASSGVSSGLLDYSPQPVLERLRSKSADTGHSD